MKYLIPDLLNNQTLRKELLDKAFCLKDENGVFSGLDFLGSSLRANHRAVFDAIAANGTQAIRGQAEVYAAQQEHIAVVRVCGKCRTAYHGRNTAELHHAFRSSDVHAWETFAAGCWYLIVRMVTG